MIFFVPKIYFINKQPNKTIDYSIQNQNFVQLDKNDRFNSQVAELEKDLNNIITEIDRVFKNIAYMDTIDTQLYIIFEPSNEYKFDSEKHIISLPQKADLDSLRKFCASEILKFCISHILSQDEIAKFQTSPKSSKNYRITLDIITNAIIRNSELKNYDYFKNNSILCNLIINNENLLNKWSDEYKKCEFEDFFIKVFDYVCSNEDIFKLIKI